MSKRVGKGAPEGKLSTVKTRTEGGRGEENTPMCEL